MEKLLIIFYLSVKFTDVFFNPTTQHNTKCNWQYKENTIKKSVQTIFLRSVYLNMVHIPYILHKSR